MHAVGTSTSSDTVDAIALADELLGTIAAVLIGVSAASMLVARLAR